MIGARTPIPSTVFWYPGYLGGRAPASSRYRVGNLVELLRGARVVMGGRVPRKALNDARILIASRPRASMATSNIVARCVRGGVLRVADFDDLLFTDDVDALPTVLSGRESRAQAAARVRRHRSVIEHFDVFTVATQPLADALRRLAPGAPIFVVPNGLSAQWVERGRSIYPSWKPGDPRVIRYLPGSTHDADFAMIAPILAKFLNMNPDVHVEVVGPLHWDRAGFPPNRIRHREMVTYDHLPRFLSSSWVNLAPLVNNGFNRCKSSIKFLEAAAFACPTIATPIPSMRGHIDGGVTLAANPEEWHHALEEMRDDEFRMDQGQRAQDYVLSHGTAQFSVEALLEAITSQLPGLNA